jgi:DNA modification methylase
MTTSLCIDQIGLRVEGPEKCADTFDNSITQKLENISWDFPKRVAHSAIEGLHPYPAKFIAELPGTLLDILPIPLGTVVLDPFCGRGTTLVECQRRGTHSYGIDLNPIACLSARVKTNPLPSSWEAALVEVMFSAKKLSGDIPVIPNLDHWFMPHVQRALASLTSAIALAPQECADLFRFALSSIIVRVSNQDSDTRYAAVSKDIDSDTVFALFSRSVHKIAKTLLSREYLLKPATVFEADVLSVRADVFTEPVGLVITSPPYPNAYEYWLYHKYRMWWLGLDPLAVKEKEIGARAHFFKSKPHTAADFVRQMSGLFELFKQVVISGGYVCFVVGRSRIHGQIIDNAETITDVASLAGFQRVFSAERVLSPNRKSFNLSHANIKTETVLVLQRD